MTKKSEENHAATATAVATGGGRGQSLASPYWPEFANGLSTRPRRRRRAFSEREYIGGGHGDEEAEEERKGHHKRWRRKSSSKSSKWAEDDFDWSRGRCSSTLVAVFAAGVAVALLAILVSERLGALRGSSESSASPLFPDPAHLLPSDEESVYPSPDKNTRPQTELQKRPQSQVQSYRECEAEALKTLTVALNTKWDKQGGKGDEQKSRRHQSLVDRARKLFDHAVNLCPSHPRVLLHYGEFLEAADHGKTMIKP